jgi:ABC-2 type transport system ATP-binding protein
MIKIENVTKTFPGITALDKINLDISEKEFFGLLGPNGAGKSTLMNCLIGYINPDEGEIFIDQLKVSRNNSAFRKRIGYIPQSIALYDDLNAVENLEIFGRLYSLSGGRLKSVIEEKLNAVQLYDRRKDKVKNYSGGMKRRLNLIAGLLHEPSVLLCDEPTVGVDPQSRNAIFEYLIKLNNEGKTIIYTTHYMEEAEKLCSRIAVIDSGKIITEGTLDKLLEKLPFEETVFIARTEQAGSKIDMLKKFGKVMEHADKYELRPEQGFLLSEFFATIEENGISYNNIELHKPTLEALFLYLTGRRLRD